MKDFAKRVLIITAIALAIQLMLISIVDAIEKGTKNTNSLQTNTRYSSGNIVEQILTPNTYSQSNEIEEKNNLKESTSPVVKDKYTTPKKLETYTVERVVDGDTFFITYNGKEEKVRLIGIDTPESVNYNPDKNCKYGTVASNYTKKLIDGKSVGIELGEGEQRDAYGRLLAYVYLNNEMVNYNLVYNGYAVVMTVSPNIRYSDVFKQAQIRAQNTKVGMWDSDVSVSDCPNKANSFIE